MTIQHCPCKAYKSYYIRFIRLLLWIEVHGITYDPVKFVLCPFCGKKLKQLSADLESEKKKVKMKRYQYAQEVEPEEEYPG